MNRHLASFLTLCLLAACGVDPTPAPIPAPTLTATLTLTPTPAPTLTPTPDLTNLSPFRAGLVSSAKSVLDEMEGASIYQLEFVISDDLAQVDGKEAVRYTNREDTPLNVVNFRLFPNILGGEMNVSNLRVDGETVEPKYSLADSLMTVPLTEPLSVGNSLILTMDFTVEVPTDVELNYGVLAAYDGVLTLAHAYPMIAVYDDEGWNAEIPPQSGDLTYADMSFFLVKITAPKDLVIAAAGSESAPEMAGKQKVWNVAAGPARDFFLAASREYEVLTRQVGEVTVNSYATKSEMAGSQAALDVAVRALETFSEQYAPYPYTELDVIATPTLALGVEYPGAIAIADRLYTDEAYGRDTSTARESTVAHEVGHQWFYNLVGNDQLDEPWLDEALAQFATWQYYKSNFGFESADGFKASFVNRWSRVNSKKIPIGQPVAFYTDSQYGAIVYGRGPLFFIALRDEIGSSAFDAFLKDYAGTFSWKIATAEDLRSLAEEHCTCDLATIFEGWVYP